MRKRPGKEHWRQLGSQSIQDVAERIDRSYKAFFQAKKEHCGGRHGTPHFCKRSNYSSFTLKQAGYRFHDGNRVTILGKDYKYVNHRPFKGTIKTVSVKRDAVGDFWLCVVCVKDEPEIVPRKGNAIGYDFGLKTFLTGSDGSHISSPRFLEAALPALRAEQKALSRKQKGSGNRTQARQSVARHHRRIGNQRRDWFYKTALSIAGQYADVCVEDLNMQEMQKLWGRKVSDYAFSEFVKILEYELGQMGGRLNKVDRFFPSSKTCSYCGYQVDSLPLSVRTWECPSCRRQLDRDVNAAQCILAQAMK